MTEAQEVQEAPTGTQREPDSGTERLTSTLRLDGHEWRLVELEDRQSWSLFGEASGDGPAPRIGHITIGEHGYLSTDRMGVVRGPYTTLDEAAYPLAIGSDQLLTDPADLTAIEPPDSVATTVPAGIAPVTTLPARRNGTTVRTIPVVSRRPKRLPVLVAAAGGLVLGAVLMRRRGGTP
jgi:hypothetical protein